MPLPIELARDAAYRLPGAVLKFDNEPRLFDNLAITHSLTAAPTFSAELIDEVDVPDGGAVATLDLSISGVDDESGYLVAEVDEPAGGFTSAGSRASVTGAGRSSRLLLGSAVPLLLQNVTDEQINTEILTDTGLGDVMDISDVAYEGYTFCTLDNSWIRVPAGQSLRGMMKSVDQFTGYASWETPHNKWRHKRINGLDDDPATIYRGFAEGVDLFSLDVRKQRAAYKNAVTVTASDIAVRGTYPLFSIVDDSRTGLQDWEADRYEAVGPHDLITTQADCEWIANRLFNGFNRIGRVCTFEIAGDPIMAPGAYVTITSSKSRISVSGFWLIVAVTQLISKAGGWVTACAAQDVWFT